MDLTGGITARSVSARPESVETGIDSLQFNEEIHRLMAVQPDSASSFTALLELPATQAVELLHSSDPRVSPTIITAGQDFKPPLHPLNEIPDVPPNAALIERAAKFSVFAGERNGNNSPETSSVPSNSSAVPEKVKSEPAETESSEPLVSDPMAENHSLTQNQRPAKRKEREKKGKWSAKKCKNSSEDAEKLPYVHVRARRGQATDSHSLAERARREKINARMKLLQELVPGCNKISGTALVLDEIINHVQSLQRQVEFLSMRLAAVNPRIDFNLDNVLAAESGSLMGSNFPSMVVPMTWPEFQVDGDRQHHQSQWHFNTIHQPVWLRDNDFRDNFIPPETSLLSYDSSANSGNLNPNQVKMEL